MIKQLFLLWVGMLLIPISSPAQTKIAKEQIEDAFVRNTGGAVFGDIQATTSTITSKELAMSTDGFRCFRLFYNGEYAAIVSDVNLYLDPTNGGVADAVIIPATVMEFDDFLGDKIRLYDTCYKIGVSPYTLDITSDRHIKFHSDTSSDLMVISGDAGDVTAKRDLSALRNVHAGGIYTFSSDTAGDKIVFWGTQYKVGISSNALDFYSDRFFQWHSDTESEAMILDADSGRLRLTGPLQLPIYAELPTGSVGEILYFDHPSDDMQDGLYVYTAAGWHQCN